MLESRGEAVMSFILPHTKTKWRLCLVVHNHLTCQTAGILVINLTKECLFGE